MVTFNNADAGGGNNNSFDLQQLLSGLGGIGAASGIFGKYQDPSKAAMGYMDRIPSTVKPYYDPYIESGRRANTQLEGQYQQQVTNPQELYQRLSQGYSESPGYQYRMREGQNAADRAASAGGMVGTPGHQKMATQMGQDIANQDFNTWLEKILGMYLGGQKGMEGMNERGFTAGTGLADILGTNMTNQAGLAYHGAEDRNQYNADTSSSFLKGIQDLLPMIPMIAGLL